MKITEVIAAAKRQDGTGFCIDCGTRHNGVPRTASRYECKECGAARVFGAEEIIIMTV